ncbi:no individualized sperm isoform X2 [Haematobia irritans]|uniref:no individualized sperm isoform X2 n=1 Tax=Haematobia irritans TaxID=7368 RepID=UPI003F4FBF8A
MNTIKFRQLIDMAIGSPEPGHVNFYALHCILSHFGQKLNILDDNIGHSSYEPTILSTMSENAFQHFRKCDCRIRMEGGSDPNEETDNQVELEHETLHVDSIEHLVHPLAETDRDILSSHTEVISNDNQLPEISMNSLNLNEDLQERISKLEKSFKKFEKVDDLSNGIAIMGDQLELVMNQLILLTYRTLSKQPNSQRLHSLLNMTQKLLSICKENYAVKNSNRFEIPSDPPIDFDWKLSEFQLGEQTEQRDFAETHEVTFKDNITNVSINRHSQFESDGCLCYSRGKLLDQLMELKSEFYILTNKINELVEKKLSNERNQILTMVLDLQEQVTNMRLTMDTHKELNEQDKIRVNNNTLNIEQLKNQLENITEAKVDRTSLEILLSEKVDYDQLQKKISIDQMLEAQCRIDKRFSEVFHQLKASEMKFIKSIETLRQTLGFNAVEENLGAFKQQIYTEIRSLQKGLQKFVESTNDECAASGTRIKVLQDLACLSCDTTCVMKTVEKSKVAKFPNSYASPSLSPQITFEVGAIRKSGLNRSRHAGGFHTKNTARDRVEKIVLNKKVAN